MPTFFPSQIVAFIDQFAPEAQQSHRRFQIGRDHAPTILGLHEMVRGIPTHLIVLTPAAQVDYTNAVAALEYANRRWEHGDDHWVLKPHGEAREHPLAVIRRHLATLADEQPAPETHALGFLPDDGFRRVLQLDVGAVNAALAASQWKAATVLAGSVVEALLLAALTNRHAEAALTNAAGEAQRRGWLHRVPNRGPEHWHLPDYVAVAAQLGLIDDHTRTQCELARDFRNLVHPGRVRRVGTPCDRGTALAAVAAVELVVRDLSRAVP
jgi:hypothetical protein